MNHTDFCILAAYFYLYDKCSFFFQKYRLAKSGPIRIIEVKLFRSSFSVLDVTFMLTDSSQ